MTHRNPEALRDLAVAVLTAARTAPANAAAVADALIAAECDGLTSHGLARLPAYADQAASGKVDGRAEPRVESPAEAVVTVDARDGFAYPAIAAGLDAACGRAPRTGIVGVAVRRSHHFGVAGHHVERLAEAGFLGLAFGNSPAGIAPWGGRKGVFGTNPLALACPRADAPPLVIDLSLSQVARGKVMLAHREGTAIPEGWAFDAEGRPTTDPAAALEGTMAPVGGAKGAALALLVEILAAALPGAAFGFEASSFFEAGGAPPRVGQLFLVLDPEAFSGGGFRDRVEVLLRAILDQPGCRLPGDRRLERREHARRAGIEVDPELLRDLQARARSR